MMAPASSRRERLGGRAWLISAALVCLGLGASPGAAATITLRSQVDCSPSPEATRCRVEVDNSGDERARELTVELATQGEGRSASIGDLGPGERRTVELAPPAPAGAGRFPVTVHLRYLDDDGYPFSVLAHAYVERGAPVAPGREAALEATLEPLTLAGEGELRWRVRNRESRPIALSATLLLPEGLTPQRDAALSIGPGEAIEGSHALSVSTALAPSRLRVYLLLEYDLDGVHRSLFVPAEVEIAAARHAAVVTREPILSFLLVAAVAGWGLELVARRRSAGARFAGSGR